MMEIITDNGLPFDSDREIENAFSSKRWDEARYLIETALADMPAGWSPLIETDKDIEGAFWKLEEFQAYSQQHFKPQGKSIIWWPPSYSKRWWQLAVINRHQEK